MDWLVKMVVSQGVVALQFTESMQIITCSTKKKPRNRRRLGIYYLLFFDFPFTGTTFIMDILSTTIRSNNNCKL